LPDDIDTSLPVGGFAFHVGIFVAGVNHSPLCTGSFADVSGLEATIEPKTIKVGGRNYGPLQRIGPVSFATVVLKRGMTDVRDLWSWWSLVTGADGKRDGTYTPDRARCDVSISLAGPDRTVLLTWQLRNAMPVKFKAGDLNARGTEVAIEELHFVHEGLSLAPGGGA
jgi:phage tail-like protein